MPPDRAGQPTIIRIEVDLPAPFGPKKPVTRPDPAANVTSSTTVRPPYLFDSDSTVINRPSNDVH
jgi:hypothetical protein